MAAQIAKSRAKKAGLKVVEPRPIDDSALCACTILHEDGIVAAREAAPDPALVAELGALFKVFADETRLKILSALAASELCVCDLASVLGASQSAVSHQLAVLRASRLVKHRREGKVVFYSLGDDHVARILAIGLEHSGERFEARAGGSVETRTRGSVQTRTDRRPA